jgi:carbonic anhydrase
MQLTMVGRRLGLIFSIVLGITACNAQPLAKQKPRKANLTPASANAMPAPLPNSEILNVPASDHYGIPFAWEKADDEPLGQTRNYLSEVMRDNQSYARHGKEFFEKFDKEQTPRATVIACADSRVQSDAWDLTPENDDFTIRNIGNQVTTSLGSVQYGIEQLNTPVLLILGHTGCGAVKAVMDHAKGLPAPLQKELDTIKIPTETSDKKSDLVWADAVAANVHHQVRVALEKFGARVVTGKLTVIGALYDLRDDLGKGYGNISIINVNGNSAPKRVRAFVSAVQEAQKVLPAPSDSQKPQPAATEPQLPAAPAGSATPSLMSTVDELNAVLGNIPGLVTKDAANKPQ